MVIAERKQENSQKIHILHDIHSIARLGEGVDKTGRIHESAFERASLILQQYRSTCEKEGVQHIYAVATSAIRDAENGQDICRRLGKILGSTVRTISGDQEALLSFTGTTETLNTTTVIDIGGGSTEYVTGANNIIEHRMSLQLGAVRLHERYLQSLPPLNEAVEAARKEIRRQLCLLPQAKSMQDGSFDTGDIVGVGGTFTTLAAIDLKLMDFDSAKVHHHSMTAQTVSEITTYLLSNSLANLLQNPAIHPKRADILPAGAIILDETLKFFNSNSCKASTKGLRYGVLYDAFNRLNA